MTRQVIPSAVEGSAPRGHPERSRGIRTHAPARRTPGLCGSRGGAETRRELQRRLMEGAGWDLSTAPPKNSRAAEGAWIEGRRVLVERLSATPRLRVRCGCR